MSDQGQWQVAGNAAEIYDRTLVPAVFAAWASQVVGLADPRPGERVLDVACGTGVVTRLASQRVGRTGNVVGLDLNPGMLAIAASSAAHANLPPSADNLEGGAAPRKCPCRTAHYDIVYCQLGLQFFPDRPAALREMHRVLVPGGRLGLMVWRGIEFSQGFGMLADALARHVSSEAASIMRAPFALGDAEELRGLIGSARFRDIVVQPVSGTVRFPSVARFVQDYVAGSPLAGHVAKVSDAARAALISEVGDVLRPSLAGGVLTFPIEAHLASAKK